MQLLARLVEGWLGLASVVVIRWLGVVDSVGLGLCAGGFGSLPRPRVVDSVGLGLYAGGFGFLPRPGVVDSVGLGLCRGLGWLLGLRCRDRPGVVGLRWVWVFAEANQWWVWVFALVGLGFCWVCGG